MLKHIIPLFNLPKETHYYGLAMISQQTRNSKRVRVDFWFSQRYMEALGLDSSVSNESYDNVFRDVLEFANKPKMTNYPSSWVEEKQNAFDKLVEEGMGLDKALLAIRDSWTSWFNIAKKAARETYINCCLISFFDPMFEDSREGPNGHEEFRDHYNNMNIYCKNKARDFIGELLKSKTVKFEHFFKVNFSLLADSLPNMKSASKSTGDIVKRKSRRRVNQGKSSGPSTNKRSLIPSKEKTAQELKKGTRVSERLINQKTNLSFSVVSHPKPPCSASSTSVASSPSSTSAK